MVVGRRKPNNDTEVVENHIYLITSSCDFFLLFFILKLEVSWSSDFLMLKIIGL